LANFMSAESASRIFVMLCLLSMLFGTMILHRAVHKRFSPWPLLSVALLFNGIFRYGFLNYIFGMGVAFSAAALWVIMKPTYLRVFIALISSIFLVLLHFEAFAVFAVIVGSIEIHIAYKHWCDKNFRPALIQLFISSTPFLITLGLFILLSPTAEVAGQGFGYPNYLGAKPYGALYSLLTGITWLDFMSLSSLTIISIFLFVTNRLEVSAPIRFALLMMIIAFIVLPSSIMGSSFVYVRLGPAIALLYITTVDIKATDVNTNRYIAGLALFLALVTSSSITSQWNSFNKETSEIIQVFNQTESGATIFSATAQPFTHLIADTPIERAAWEPPLKHVSSYAVLSGPKFVPMTFADLTKQPMNVAVNYRKIKDFQGDNPRKTYTGQELESFLLEIKGHIISGDWPTLDNIYVFVMGFDRIKKSFNITKFEGWAHIVELKQDHVLIKLN